MDEKTKERINEALAYVRENKDWSKEEEDFALHKLGTTKRPLSQINEYIYVEIGTLMGDWSEENNLERDWWEEHYNEDEIFTML